MRALGRVVEVSPAEGLTRFDYYLALANVLMHCATSHHRSAAHLEELAHSYSRDFLNLANLASRLLWFEGVTPDLWRSHDLVSVAVDASSYFVTLQTACDIMADIVATLGTRKGQAPSESFHSLTEWAKRNPNRTAEEFRVVGRRLPWFEEINSVRTKLVHRGGDIRIYTDRVRFHWGVHLHVPPKKPHIAQSQPEAGTSTDVIGRPPRRIIDRGYLLTDLQRLTRLVLSFSTRLARCVAKHRGLHSVPRKYVISGAFVPALHHMVRCYEPPELSASLKLNAKRLVTCGDYATAAYLGYPNEFCFSRLAIFLSVSAVSHPIARTRAIPNAIVRVRIAGTVHQKRPPVIASVFFVTGVLLSMRTRASKGVSKPTALAERKRMGH
jgi:hypothetical protein